MSLGRPAMRGGEERRVREQLAKHAELMQRYIREGKTPDEASKQALQDMKSKVKKP